MVPRGAAAQNVDALTSDMARAVAEEGLIGVTWSRIAPEGVTLGAAGLRDRVRQIPMQPGDRVQVGSIAKALLATGVLMLATEGRVDLDAPAARYLPGVVVDNPWSSDAPLLVRHLLDHTGGLEDVHLWQVFTLRSDPDAPLSHSLGREGRAVHVRYPPGARSSYSNVGYLLLGMIIEEVTAERYESWLDANLLRPLAMHNSTFAFVSQTGQYADTTLAMGHFEDGSPYASFAVPVRPATQFTTTAADMALFARFLMSDGVVNGRTLVDRAMLLGMAVPTTTEAVQAGLTSGYALGLAARDRWGITGKCHLGNMGTFRAILCLYPEHQRAFFAAYNIDPEDANWNRPDSILATSLRVPQDAPLPAAAPDSDPAAWNGWYAVRPHRFGQFAYLDEVFAITRVAWTGQVLRMQPFQGREQTLQSVGGALFSLSGRQNATHVLATTSDNVRILSDGFRTFEQVSKWRVIALWISALLGALAVIYILIAGTTRSILAWRRKRLRNEPLRWASAALLMLIIAPLLYLAYPFLAIGDPTAANVLMSVLTALLPVALTISLVQRVQSGMITRAAVLDAIALSAALQWCVMLIFWRLVPLMLWR